MSGGTFWDVSFDDDETVLVLCTVHKAKEEAVRGMESAGRKDYTIDRIVSVVRVKASEGIRRLQVNADREEAERLGG